MKKAELNARLRDYVRLHLSPSAAGQELVTRLYAAVRAAVGESCYLVGSYARFTASRPMHDLDVLYVAGTFDERRIQPQHILNHLHRLLDNNFSNPTRYRHELSQQTHSITICFLEGRTEKFAVDVVPAFESGVENEFGHNIYWVPEILRVSRRNRAAKYTELEKRNRQEADWWIRSDPRGYIGVAKLLNDGNPDFRKATKLVKRWKFNCKKAHEQFPLKSFHIEQVVAEIFKRDLRLDISDVVFKFFCELPDAIAYPQIRDRADTSQFIDSYLTDMTPEERRIVVQARDAFLILLEDVSQTSDLSTLLDGGLYERSGVSEHFLFDQRIPVLTERGADLRIVADVLSKPGFRPFQLDAPGLINIDRRIRFSSWFYGPETPDLFKWKVKNDNNSPQPRGEITDHSTQNNPEITKYNGAHFVECYAIKDRKCIAKSRQNVVLRRG